MVKQKKWNGRAMCREAKPIISIKEARKFLGEAYDEFTDDEIMGIIYTMTRFAITQLDQLEVPESD